MLQKPAPRSWSKFVKPFVGPARVAHFHRQRVFVEHLEQRFEAREIFRGVVKRKRELQQHGAQLVGVAEDVESLADDLLVVRIGAIFVSKLLPEFGGE
jgi:hypothetical protein